MTIIVVKLQYSVALRILRCKEADKYGQYVHAPEHPGLSARKEQWWNFNRDIAG